MPRSFLLVEGFTDKLFAERVLGPALVRCGKASQVSIVEHARKSKKQVSDIVRSANAMDAGYLYLADLDDTVCKARKKALTCDTHPCLSTPNVLVVVQEIEGWYLAGLDRRVCQQLGMEYIPRTDNITKEQFQSLRPGRFKDAQDFMMEILKHFDLRHALVEARNTSLSYFFDRHCRPSSAD